MERPGGSRLKVRNLWLEVRARNVGQEAHGHQTICEDIVNERFCFNIAKRVSFEVPNLTDETREVFLESDDGECEFLSEIESGGVLAFEGDQIAAEGEIVTDH